MEGRRVRDGIHLSDPVGSGVLIESSVGCRLRSGKRSFEC